MKKKILFVLLILLILVFIFIFVKPIKKLGAGLEATAFSSINSSNVYLIGGSGPDGVQDETVWRSSNSINWNQLSGTMPLPKIMQHKAVFFKGKLWVVGGIDYTSWNNPNLPAPSSNAVYNSVDGKNWVHVDTNLDKQGIQNAPWAGRIGHQLIVFNNKMFLIGGGTNLSPYPDGNDVWSSVDGINWVQITAHAPWQGRMNFSSVVFANKIWILGGVGWSGNNFQDFNDVWSSVDGINWIQVTPSADWSPRAVDTGVVYNNKIWLFGGISHTPYGYLNDAWYSTDGINWIQSSGSIISSSSFRSLVGVYVLNNKMNIVSSENPNPPLPGNGFDNNIYTSNDGISFTLIRHNPEWFYVDLNGPSHGPGRENFSTIVIDKYNIIDTLIKKLSF